MALPKLNKNVLFIGGALLLGGLAALMSVTYVKDTISKAVAEAQVDETEIVVSALDLEVGQAITEDEMVLRSVPTEFVPADAVTADNYGEYVDRLVRSPVRGGAPLSASALVPAAQQFSRVIPLGRVGYTLSVNENNSVSGMISPGDAVDIFFTVGAEETDSGAGPRGRSTGERVFPLLENVTVLATGARVGETLGGDEDEAYSTMTLELTPDQAQRLTVAEETGDLRIILRNLDDKTPFNLDGLTENELMASFGGIKADGVEYIIGGSN